MMQRVWKWLLDDDIGATVFAIGVVVGGLFAIVLIFNALVRFMDWLHWPTWFKE